MGRDLHGIAAAVRARSGATQELRPATPAGVTGQYPGRCHSNILEVRQLRRDTTTAGFRAYCPQRGGGHGVGTRRHELRAGGGGGIDAFLCPPSRVLCFPTLPPSLTNRPLGANLFVWPQPQ